MPLLPLGPPRPQLSQLVSEGRVKVHVDRVVGLEDVVAAHEEAERSRTRGKVVVRVACVG